MIGFKYKQQSPFARESGPQKQFTKEVEEQTTSLVIE
jgi:hypothetical protein